MQKLLLILSFSLGLASPIFAADYADTILEKGRILDKRLVPFKGANGEDTQHLRAIVVYKDYVYECWVYLEIRKGMNCREFHDFGVLSPVS